tara:strand:- start:3183 stop:3326 length:144 start_codon:yes stop_codon:yes gene_type:complete
MAKKKVRVIDYSKEDVLKDYKNGIKNFRVLAKKHKKTLKEINKIIKL